MDFKKAFDTVPHKRLIQKLEAHSIKGTVAVWIKNWLSDRKQRVVVNGGFLKWKEVCSGVPQGSVLGPLLFLIYINDLDLGIESTISKFADDTKLGRVVNSEEDCNQLQADIHRMVEWADMWQMDFNVDKCEVIHLGRKNDRRQYRLGSSILRGVNVQRDLGVQVSKSLKVAGQVDNAVKKAFGVLSFISRGIEYKSREVMVNLYKTLFRPQLEYCVQFWAPYFRKDIKAQERV
uniref:Reverse transcriptase domain-containing protein n=1 Tax=Callorhinchus milii TaxID=7868 RepID=A0A4W3GR14_CALMI